MFSSGKRQVHKGGTGPPTMHLPSQVYEMFAPRPPLEKVTSVDLRPGKKMRKEYNCSSSVSEILYSALFDKNVASVGYCAPGPYPFPRQYILDEQTQAKRRQDRMEKRRNRRERKRQQIGERLASYCPTAPELQEKKTKHAFNTMFVAGIKRKLASDRIEKHCKKFGKVLKVAVYPKRGYAFVEFAEEADLKRACSQGSFMTIDGERLIVDVERARTVKDWKPKCLGGGITLRERHRYRGAERRDTGRSENKRGRDEYFQGSSGGHERRDRRRRDSSDQAFDRRGGGQDDNYRRRKFMQ